MPTYVLAAIAAVTLSVPLLIWSLLAADPVHARSVSNLRRGLEVGSSAPVPTSTASSAPQHRGLARIARRLLPTATVRLDRLLGRAGRPVTWPLDRVLAAKLVLPVVAALLGLVYLRSAPGALAVGLAIAVTVLAAFVPELLLHSRGQERSRLITLELADTLDQVSIAVEAGLGFDAAMARSARTGRGPLAQELRRTQQDMQVGQSRRQAYEGLADRTGVPDLAKFVRSVLQADAYGIPVAEVLRGQAAEARTRRRQQAEEKAMKIPTKVVFPLMIFIMPVMFIILLGPAVLSALGSFS